VGSRWRGLLQGPVDFSLCIRQMARQPRSPHAFLVKGGRWFRPPKPKPRPIAKPELPHEENKKKTRPRERPREREDTGYDTCDEKIRGDVTAALVAAALPVIECLQESGDFGAANIVQSLCERLQHKEEMVERIRRGLEKAREQRDMSKAQVQAQGDLQGQSARHWHQVKKLKGQLDWAMLQNCMHRRKLWEIDRKYVPYRHPR